MKIIDRYVIRQVLMPIWLGLAVFTFLLIIPSLIEYAESFVAKGVPTLVVLRLMATLLPSSLALTIPMSLLLGLLVGFGRLSADREFVALQACGVSLARLLRPVALVSLTCWAASSYVWIVLVPASNQLFREITFNVLASSAEGDVKPRVFFTEFPNLTIYVREIPPTGGGWNGVFMADARNGSPPAIYLADHGRVLIDRQKHTVAMVLDHAMRHTVDPSGKYQVGRFEHILLTVDPDQVFPRGGPTKGDNEMTIAELRARIAENEKASMPTANQWMAIHRKFSIPMACLVFGLIGLALGATNRRDGTLGSFVLGLIIVFAYYVPLYLGPAMAKGGLVPPWLAVWAPNFILGALGIALFVWRGRVADRAIRIPVPASLGGFVARLFRVGTAPGVRVPGLSLLDRYVAAMYGRIMLLSGVAMAAIFYISTFIDLSDKVFRGTATWAMLWSYLWFATPQYVYYIIPLSVLLASLVTVSVLTKNSELTVLKACGVSLYRFALPMVVCAVVAAGGLFLLDQAVLGQANRRAESIRLVMRGLPGDSLDAFTRQWAVSPAGSQIYHYNYFDPKQRQLLSLEMYELDPGMHRVTERTVAQRAQDLGTPIGAQVMWKLEHGWTRDFDEQGEPRNFAAFEETQRPLETPAYFSADAPDARFMSYTQLRSYTQRLQASGLDVLAQQVALARKVSFPFITLIMTLIAVPFAVTIGRSGAMAGIGVGIALAIGYWVTISVFAALGAGGLMAPLLAAWAPNVLFGAGAGYMLLTVKT